MCSRLCYEGERSRCAGSEVFWLREGADMRSISLIHRPRLKLLLTLDSADMLFPNRTLQHLPCLCAGEFREEEKYLNKYADEHIKEDNERYGDTDEDSK